VDAVNLADIQRHLGVDPDGKLGPVTLGAIAKAIGMADEPAAPADPFEAALTEVLVHEGGFSNHARDPGGMTNLGVTKRTWEAWTGKPATESEMRSLTRAKVAPLYRKNYWDAVRADDLPPALALVVFDFAVNAGPARAARYLQQLVGVAMDGKIGPQTIAATVSAAGKRGDAALVKDYSHARRNYYRSLSTFDTFGRGWLRRVDEVEQAALELVR
jgi:lysozyme family protein